ncbi:MAG: DUF6472 family protein [Clostridia bacterium]|nr:DUF6472 family protein [Clostridia bacterium]
MEENKTNSVGRNGGKAKKRQSNCETCQYYIFDEYFQANVCDIDLDEDETYKFMTDTFRDCPYYRYFNEYELVSHQN